jgi:hypothetical protein
MGSQALIYLGNCFHFEIQLQPELGLTCNLCGYPKKSDDAPHSSLATWGLRSDLLGLAVLCGSEQ